MTTLIPPANFFGMVPAIGSPSIEFPINNLDHAYSTGQFFSMLPTTGSHSIDFPIVNLSSSFVLSATMVLALGTEDGRDKKAKSTLVSSSSASAPSSISSEISLIGDKVSAPPLVIVVNSAQQKQRVGNEYFNSTPSEGATYVGINCRCKNIGKRPLSMWPKPEMKLRYAEGKENSDDIGAASSYATEIDLDEIILSDLNPEATVNSAAGFAISKESLQNPG